VELTYALRQSFWCKCVPQSQYADFSARICIFMNSTEEVIVTGVNVGIVLRYFLEVVLAYYWKSLGVVNLL